jgi:hypothetical protein
MHLGGVTIPTSIENSGRYLFEKEILGTNGNDEDIESIYATVTWTFTYMDMADYEWIVTTLLGNNASLKVSSAQLKNDLGNLQTFTNAVVKRPRYAYASGGEANDVTWEITKLR